MREIKQIKIKNDMKVSELVENMKYIGFGARKIGEASEILKEMINDRDCKTFLGVAGAMVPGGMKEIIIDMLDEGVADVFVTTGANLTHDLIEALGEKHYQLEEPVENVDDIKLKDKKIDRIYDVLLKEEVYQSLEDFFEKIYSNLPKKMNIKEFLWEIGRNVEDKKSILRICYEKKIPIFCPGIADSGIGLMIWGRLIKGENVDETLKNKGKLNVDVFDDLREMLDLAWTCKKAGVIYVGGGLPKNFIQQAMQFSVKQDGADYGIQITTDRPESGGSSGAPLTEGISWGKMKKKGKYVNVYCDATIALPLIYGAIKEVKC
ncbi:deoxyhypusine synthase [Candidatus Pacearchaeota archaeon]|nr:deoxyhypusine synthase [Candidatus Pacearchaeota archaeon]